MTDYNSKYTGEQVESLLDMVASNDIPKETYLADFTMFSLRQGMNNGGQVNCDMNSLIEAMTANKTILVREDEESDGFKGVCVLNGYAEDLLYFTIVDHAGDILYCEGTNYTNTSSYIDGRTLYVRRWDDKQDALVSGENIKTINGNSIVGEGNIEISGGSGEVGPQGPQGEKGDKGDTGVGVQSVVQTTTSNADGGSNIVTVTLTDGTKSTFTVKNGSKGSQGIQGEQGQKGDTGANGTNGKDGADGEDGATFTPSVDSAGNLSWSNNKGLANPPTVNIKGPKGDAGSGGGGSSGGGGKEFVEMESGFEPGGYTGSFVFSDPLEPNKVYVFSQPINSLYVNYINESGSVGDEYTIMFTAGEKSPLITISYDYQVYWANGTIPSIAVGDMCELSLVRIGNVMKATLGIFKAV
jgi:hypothetical protein